MELVQKPVSVLLAFQTEIGLTTGFGTEPPFLATASRKLTLTPPLNRGEEAGYIIIIRRLSYLSSRVILLPCMPTPAINPLLPEDEAIRRPS